MAIELTDAQVKLLLFLGDQGAQPASTRHSSYAALRNQGLIRRNDEGSLRYEITDLGRQALLSLGSA